MSENESQATGTAAATKHREIHVLCCQGEPIALCGSVIREVLVGVPDETCVVCSDLDSTDFCPRFQRCAGEYGTGTEP